VRFSEQFLVPFVQNNAKVQLSEAEQKPLRALLRSAFGEGTNDHLFNERLFNSYCVCCLSADYFKPIASQERDLQAILDHFIRENFVYCDSVLTSKR
jgi:hypothetical protein